MTIFVPRFRNQGQKIAAGWDAPVLFDWTSLIGTDGVRFAPPSDRNGYTDGVTRRLNTGGTRQSGLPIVRLAFPWVSDGQIEYMVQTLLGGTESGNVTTAVHIPPAVGVNDTSVYNAVMNLNLEQLRNLTRRGAGYEDFEVELVLVEPVL